MSLKILIHPGHCYLVVATGPIRTFQPVRPEQTLDKGDLMNVNAIATTLYLLRPQHHFII